MNFTDTKFYSGTSGLVLPVSQSLYPAAFQGKSRLEYYASLFNSVEINSSFYKLPKAATVSKWKWAESVRDNFRFTFKLSKTITHVTGLNFNAEDVGLFMHTVDHIGNKSGCILIQFPPSLKFEKYGQVKKLLACIDALNADRRWKVAVEFRNASWYNDEVYDLLSRYNATLVIHDLPASATPLTAAISGFTYLRFHGPGGKYRGSYADEFLSQYAHHIRRWIKQGTVYSYFNNTMGDAVRNLHTLNDMYNSIV